MDEGARFPRVGRKAGHYESFYVKACEPGGGRGIWIRHTVHKRPGEEASAREGAGDGLPDLHPEDVTAQALQIGALPERLAVAVQDHGYQPGAGNNDVRFAYLQSLLNEGSDLRRMVYTTPPDGMTRMAAVAQAYPGAILMDTGAAAVLGALADPVVGQAAAREGAILVNVGNMHTFATLVRGGRAFGAGRVHRKTPTSRAGSASTPSR